MSAFLVDDKHLSFILTWAIDNGTLGGLSPQSWFKEFTSENVKSLKARYPDSYHDLIYWNTDNSRYIPIFNAIRPQKYSQAIAVATISFVRCWEYQSCEHDPDKGTLPWRMMGQIKDVAMQKSGWGEKYDPDSPLFDTELYEATPWEYNSRSWKQFLLHLQKEEVNA